MKFHNFLNQISILITFVCLCLPTCAQSQDIKLLIRVDDMGAAHAVNEACLETLKEGIATSVEVMVPTPWFTEAVEMLKENPGIDVGVHLTLTSEWKNMKWRPLTPVKSFVDENGYFFPMTGRNENFPANSSFFEADWKIEEVEKEIRAQIEMAIKNINNVTHLSAHMGVATSTPELRALTQRLAKEYGLEVDLSSMKRLEQIGEYKQSQDTPAEERIRNFIQILEKLEPGIWLFVEHPAYDTPEMQAIHHIGYEHVAFDRQAVTEMLIDPRVKAVIEQRKIQLVSYADLKE
jgi:chitin disaccharide deacetylase